MSVDCLRAKRAASLCALVLLFACSALVFAPNAFADDAISQGDEKPEANAGELGYTFKDTITVGEDDAVECTFKVIDAGKRLVQIGSGNKTATAVDRSVQGAIQLPERAVDRDGDQASYQVSKIGEWAFSFCYYITDTGFGSNSTVTTVDDYGFDACARLKSTGLASNTRVTALGKQCFDWCPELESTGLGQNKTVKTLGFQVFGGCTSLTSTGLDSNEVLTTLNVQIFYGCTGLRSTGLERNTRIAVLPFGLFYGCTSLTSTGLAGNRTVREVGQLAFAYCPALGTAPEPIGAAKERTNAGDLVLNAPDGGTAKFSIGAHAFAGTEYHAVYLRGDKDRFDFDRGAFEDCVNQGMELKTKIEVAYVPASWVSNSIWDDAGRRFSVYDGTLVVMDPLQSADSAVRVSATSDSATLALAVNSSFEVEVDGARYGALGRFAVGADGTNKLQRVSLTIPSGRHVSRASDEKIGPSADTLTVSVFSPTMVVYPAGATMRSYNGAVSTARDCSLPAVKYSIRFDPNGGTGSMGEEPLLYDTTGNLPLNEFSRTYYHFTGWNTMADATGASFADGASVQNLADVEGAVVPLYAQWETSVSVDIKIRAQSRAAEGGGEARPLPGCALELYLAPDMQHPKSIPETNGNGETIATGLKPGDYTLRNICAPSGYQLMRPDRTFTITEDGHLVPPTADRTIVLEFQTNPNLPLTGESRLSAPPLAAAGATVAVLSAAYLVARRQQGR